VGRAGEGQHELGQAEQAVLALFRRLGRRVSTREGIAELFSDDRLEFGHRGVDGQRAC
jgi:hypothetical protein